jgi:hypothetical protein
MPAGSRSSDNGKKPCPLPRVTEIDPAEAKRLIEADIQKELKKLRGELVQFSDPTPADNPHEHEPEEIEAFEKLKERIRSLEADLEEITNYRP